MRLILLAALFLGCVTSGATEAFKVLSVGEFIHRVAEPSNTSRMAVRFHVKYYSINLETKNGMNTYYILADGKPEVTALKTGDAIIPAFYRDEEGRVGISDFQMVSDDGKLSSKKTDSVAVTIDKVTSDGDLMTLETRNGIYEVDTNRNPWAKKALRQGVYCRFSYFELNKVDAENKVVKKKRVYATDKYRDKHSEYVVVTKINKYQHYLFISTNFDDIFYQIDTAEAYTAKTLRVGSRITPETFQFRVILPAGSAVSIPSPTMSFGGAGGAGGAANVNVNVDSRNFVNNRNNSSNNNTNVSNIESNITNTSENTVNGTNTTEVNSNPTFNNGNGGVTQR